MRVFYTDFSKDLGFDYYNNDKPLYLKSDVNVIVDKLKIKIPEGFRSDGCTIPKIFWLLIGCPHTGKYIPASIIHDALILLKPVIKRQFASKVFENVLIQMGVNKIQAKIMYILVELYQKYWRKWK